jgi:acyl-CoA dehydrogenase
VNLHLDPADLAFRDEVRAFLSEHLTPAMREGQWMTSGSYPDPAIAVPWQRALNARGWLAPLWPRELGGTGWSGLQRYLFENECALAGAPTVHPMGVRFVGPVIARFGTDEQRRCFLPRILASEDYWCQGFSEPGSGSDLASLSLQARRDGDHYVLQGSKTWTTNAHFANRMFALVRTSREGRPQEGISFLLVDMAAPGITVRPIRTIGGDHDVNQVFFDEVRVPVAHRVGGEGEGWACAKYLLEFERGAGIFAPRLRAQLRRVGEAMRRGALQPPDRLARFAALTGALDAFEWLEVRTMAAIVPGRSPGPVASVLKLRSSRLKQDIAQLGIDVLGEAALRWRVDDGIDDPLARFARVMVPEYCNSRAYTIFGGALEIQLNLIARTVLADAGLRGLA